MFWYKGIRLILDALEGLKSQGTDFRMVFVGGGADFDEIKAYSEKLRLNDRVFFTGALKSRDSIRAWYCRADLFLFPSTYDTNGLVVREASSCSLPSVLVSGSCAAEGVTDGQNGFFISETAASLAVLLDRLCKNRDLMKRVGENASKELYISWDTAVSMAYERYEAVIDNYKCGLYPKHSRISDALMTGNGVFFAEWGRRGRNAPTLDDLGESSGVQGESSGVRAELLGIVSSVHSWYNAERGIEGGHGSYEETQGTEAWRCGHAASLRYMLDVCCRLLSRG